MDVGPLQEIFPARQEVVRCHGSLSKLRRHIEGPVVITGGIAVCLHSLIGGARRIKGRLNDIDVVVEGPHSLRASLRRDFLIRHFHPARERGKILIMIVDEEHGTRIDVFTPGTDSLMRRLTDLPIDGLPLKLISAEDLLAKLLSILYPVTEGRRVKPKYFDHFHSLFAAADPEMAREVWREYRKENQPLEFEEAAKDVERSVTANPALLRESSYSQDINQGCSWCHISELYPLAPLTKIHEILGYV
jgi:hypothetical protein